MDLAVGESCEALAIEADGNLGGEGASDEDFARAHVRPAALLYALALVMLADDLLAAKRFRAWLRYWV